jgi:hypothetical protein
MGTLCDECDELSLDDDVCDGCGTMLPLDDDEGRD